MPLSGAGLVDRSGCDRLGRGSATGVGQAVPDLDCGTEMALHKDVTATRLPVLFAHPHSPWERGRNIPVVVLERVHARAATPPLPEN